jgi:hypothetical protein
MNDIKTLDLVDLGLAKEETKFSNVIGTDEHPTKLV